MSVVCCPEARPPATCEPKAAPGQGRCGLLGSPPRQRAAAAAKRCLAGRHRGPVLFATGRGSALLLPYLRSGRPLVNSKPSQGEPSLGSRRLRGRLLLGIQKRGSPSIQRRGGSGRRSRTRTGRAGACYRLNCESWGLRTCVRRSDGRYARRLRRRWLTSTASRRSTHSVAMTILKADRTAHQYSR
jgi:hypothetical protein